jgi:ribosomal protein L7/L12
MKLTFEGTYSELVEFSKKIVAAERPRRVKGDRVISVTDGLGSTRNITVPKALVSHIYLQAPLNKIEAIKEVRSRLDVGLKEAKDIVETVIETQPL